MSQTTMAAQTTLLLEGHLLDSLTLSKVIDRIQELGGDYTLNHIQIGDLKRKTSMINITIQAPDQPRLDTILEELKPYGPKGPTGKDAQLVTLNNPSQIPDNALTIKLPTRVNANGKALALSTGGGEAHLVVDAQTGSVTVKPASAIAAGETIVVGLQGVDWS